MSSCAGKAGESTVNLLMCTTPIGILKLKILKNKIESWLMTWPELAELLLQRVECHFAGCCTVENCQV